MGRARPAADVLRWGRQGLRLVGGRGAEGVLGPARPFDQDRQQAAARHIGHAAAFVRRKCAAHTDARHGASRPAP